VKLLTLLFFFSVAVPGDLKAVLMPRSENEVRGPQERTTCFGLFSPHLFKGSVDLGVTVVGSPDLLRPRTRSLFTIALTGL